MVVEIFIDAGRGEQDPVILTQFNITKVIKDSIQLNFGECGLAGSLGSLQGTTSNYFWNPFNLIPVFAVLCLPLAF